MSTELTAVTTVAGLMALAARTAPKGKGVDTLFINVLNKKETQVLATRLSELGKEHGIGFYLRDAQNLSTSDACVLIGAQGDIPAGINCGACGYETCAEMVTIAKQRKDNTSTPFSGPNCAIRMADLGIALGSAVKTAQIHNVDNRIMYSGGVAAKDLNLMGKECTVVYAIPLSATGKNIFFDRQISK